MIPDISMMNDAGWLVWISQTCASLNPWYIGLAFGAGVVIGWFARRARWAKK